MLCRLDPHVFVRSNFYIEVRETFLCSIDNRYTYFFRFILAWKILLYHICFAIRTCENETQKGYKGEELVITYQRCYQKLWVMELRNLRNSGSSLQLTNSTQSSPQRGFIHVSMTQCSAYLHTLTFRRIPLLCNSYIWQHFLWRLNRNRYEDFSVSGIYMISLFYKSEIRLIK